MTADRRMAPAPAAPVGAALNIVLASDWFLPRLGGIETQLAGLARGLAARGHRVRVVTSLPGPGEIDGVAVDRLPLALAPKVQIAVSPRLVAALRQAFVRGGYDIVHVHLSIVAPLAYAAILAARGLNLPTVVTFHSVLLTKPHILRLLAPLTGWRAWPMLLSAVGQRVAAQVSRAAPGREITVLPNGVDTDFWRGAAQARAAEDGRVVIAAAMRLNRRKRPLALLHAFARARGPVEAAGRRLALRIAGEGPQRRAMERFIVRAGIEGEVTLAGTLPREGLRALYGEADIFALSSIRESFGIAALEARCAGLPVVAMRAAGVSDFLRDRETGLLAGDDAGLAGALVRLALDDALRARLAAPDPALARHDWPAVVEAHLAAYARAAAMLAAG